MHTGRRKREHFPADYKGFHLIRARGRVYGIPPTLDQEWVMHSADPFTHPAVLNAATLAEMRECIDGFDYRTVTPETIGYHAGYNVIRLRGRLYGVPMDAPPGDLHLADERQRLGV